jgi:hypothetical protein
MPQQKAAVNRVSVDCSSCFHSRRSPQLIKGFSIKDCDAGLSSDSLVGQSPQVRAYTKHKDFIRL